MRDPRSQKVPGKKRLLESKDRPRSIGDRNYGTSQLCSPYDVMVLGHEVTDLCSTFNLSRTYHVCDVTVCRIMCVIRLSDHALQSI
jgi:hypothetical protein